jgi:hypothetical protein
MLPTCASAADDAAVERLQLQIDAMQQQFKQQINDLKRQLNEAKKSLPKAQPVAAEYTKAPPSATAPWPAPGVKVTLGGFLEAGGIWRERNEVSDIGHPPFSELPFANSPLYHEHEYRFSARQSRLTLLATGDIGAVQHLSGYYEMHFLGAGVTSNSRESNSYTPRIRQVFAATPVGVTTRSSAWSASSPTECSRPPSPDRGPTRPTRDGASGARSCCRSGRNSRISRPAF